MKRSQHKIDMFVWNTFQNDARVKNEADTLSKAGYQVTVHALHAPGYTQKREELPSGVQVIRYGSKQGLRLLRPKKHTARRNLFEFIGLIFSRLFTHSIILYSLFSRRPTVIHAHDVNVLPTAWMAAKLARAKLIYDAHEISSSREGYAKIGPLIAWIEKKIMPNIAGSISTTDARAKFFARAYKVARPLVLQNRPRKSEAIGSNRLRVDLELKNDWPVVIYQGGMQSGRGLPLLVGAAKEVPNAYFVFVGGGSQAAELQSQAEQLGITHRVRFIPMVPLHDLPLYTASADIGVQPIENTCLNHFTTDSNKLFEYVQAGLAVIASDLPEIRGVVRTHDLGLLVSSGDRDALVSALKTLVEDIELCAQFGKNARKAALVLNWEEQEHKLLDLYNKVIDESPHV